MVEQLYTNISIIVKHQNPYLEKRGKSNSIRSTTPDALHKFKTLISFHLRGTRYRKKCLTQWLMFQRYHGGYWTTRQLRSNVSPIYLGQQVIPVSYTARVKRKRLLFCHSTRQKKTPILSSQSTPSLSSGLRRSDIRGVFCLSHPIGCVTPTMPGRGQD